MRLVEDTVGTVKTFPVSKILEEVLTPAHPGGAKGARTPRGSKAKTVKSANFWLIFI